MKAMGSKREMPLHAVLMQSKQMNDVKFFYRGARVFAYNME
jgi:hypothetical protein